MLDYEEHSGLFTFLGGMIVIVMVAVGISLVMDKKFKSSTGVGELRREVREQEEEIKELAVRHNAQEMLLLKNADLAKNSRGEKAGLDREAVFLKEQEAVLREKKAGLLAAVAKLETDFSQYRAKYRTRTWAAAVGENLGDITLRGGRDYKGAQITKVTDVGLEIRHEHGFARLQAPDLSTALQDRFQWNDEERRLRLKEEDERLHGKPKPAVAVASGGDDEDPGASRQETVTSKDAGDARAEREEKRAKLRASREKVRAWKSKVSRLSSERSEAVSNSYGSSNSVPGSLETWKTRSERLAKELAHARHELDIARGRLAAISPDDPELAQEPQR